MSKTYECVDSYEGFVAIAKEAGLQYLGYGDYWLILWKPGTTEGWITKTASYRCYCSDCISDDSEEMLRDMIANIGLTTVAIGEREYDAEQYLQCYIRGVVSPKTNAVFREFQALYMPKKKREEEIVKIRQLLPNVQEELAKRRTEIERLAREVSLLEEELEKLTQEEEA